MPRTIEKGKTPSPKPKKSRISKGPTSLPASGGSRTNGSAIRGIFGERAPTLAALLGQLTDYNPDELVINKGKGVQVYQDMLRDPYVKGALCLKKFSVSRLPLKIRPHSNSERDVEIAQFVDWCLENMDVSMDDVLWGMMDAVDTGYSLGETNWRVIDHGRWRGKIGYQSIKSKDPAIYTFDTDPFGNILHIYQRYGYYGSSDGTDRLLPKDKFVIMSFMPKYSNPYGSSDLRAAYRAFFIKDMAWKFRAIFMEKFGLPPIAGFFPNGTPQSKIDKLLEVLDSIQNDTVVAIPEDIKVQIMQMAASGPTEYERAIGDLNKEIIIGIVGAFLSMEEGHRTGARAQGQVHLRVAEVFIDHLARAVQSVITRQIVRRLVDLNYNVDGNYPKAQFELTDTAKLLKEMEIDKGLKDLGISLAPEYYYDKYRRPIPQEPHPVVDEPETVLDPAFEAARNDSIPQDGESIGSFREMYRVWALAENRKIHGKQAYSIGWTMAGEERDHFRAHGRWMTASEAYKKFLEVVSSVA